MTTSSRIAVGGRFSVARADLDADLGDVGLLAVGGRVVEDVRAGGVGVEEQLAVGRQRRSSASMLRSVGRTSVGCWATNSGSLSGSVSFSSTSRRIGLADDRHAGVVAGVGFVVGVLQAHRHDDRALVGGAEVVADRVRQLDALRRRVRVRREHDLAGRVGHDLAGRGGRVLEGDRVEDERVAVGVDVVAEHVERRRPAAARRGDVVVRLRGPVGAAVRRGDLHRDGGRGAGVATVGDRVAERDRADEAGGGGDLDAAAVGGDLHDAVTARRLDRRDDEDVAVRVGVVEQHVDVDRPVDAGLGGVVAGDRRLVRALLVDLVGLHDLGVRVVRVDLGDDLAALARRCCRRSRRRRAGTGWLPQSSTRSRRCCGLVTHAAPVSTSLIHTHPLTSRSRSSEPAPSSGACCTSVQPPCAVAAPLGERAGAVDTANTQPPNAIGAVGAVPGSWPTSGTSVPSPPSGMATSRPSVVAATTWSAPPRRAAAGSRARRCRRRRARRRRAAPPDPGVASTRSPSGSASTAVSSPERRDRHDVVGELDRRG